MLRVVSSKFIKGFLCSADTANMILKKIKLLNLLTGTLLVANLACGHNAVSSHHKITTPIELLLKAELSFARGHTLEANDYFQTLLDNHNHPNTAARATEVAIESNARGYARSSSISWALREPQNSLAQSLVLSLLIEDHDKAALGYPFLRNLAAQGNFTLEHELTSIQRQLTRNSAKASFAEYAGYYAKRHPNSKEGSYLLALSSDKPEIKEQYLRQILSQMPEHLPALELYIATLVTNQALNKITKLHQDYRQQASPAISDSFAKAYLKLERPQLAIAIAQKQLQTLKPLVAQEIMGQAALMRHRYSKAKKTIFKLTNPRLQY